MIDHREIPDKYEGWEQTDRGNGNFQYWYEKRKISLFFNDNILDYMEVAFSGIFAKVHVPDNWTDFEKFCQMRNIPLKRIIRIV